MPEVRVVRTYPLGLARARELALQGADPATYPPGVACAPLDNRAALFAPPGFKRSWRQRL